LFLIKHNYVNIKKTVHLMTNYYKLVTANLQNEQCERGCI